MPPHYTQEEAEQMAVTRAEWMAEFDRLIEADPFTIETARELRDVCQIIHTDPAFTPGDRYNATVALDALWGLTPWPMRTA